jgi:hypothetical protein
MFYNEFMYEKEKIEERENRMMDQKMNYLQEIYISLQFYFFVFATQNNTFFCCFF